MEKSESIVNLAKALSEFHKSVGKVKKSETNPFFKSKYADLSAILDVIEEPLNNNGLSIVQLPKGINQLETILLHESGEYISETYTVTPVKNDPQSLGSSITYQRRYALGSILSLNIDKDDDGNAAGDKDDKKETNAKIFNDGANSTFNKQIELAKKILDCCQNIESLGTMFKSLEEPLQKATANYCKELKLKLTPKQ